MVRGGVSCHACPRDGAGMRGQGEVQVSREGELLSRKVARAAPRTGAPTPAAASWGSGARRCDLQRPCRGQTSACRAMIGVVDRCVEHASDRRPGWCAGGARGGLPSSERRGSVRAVPGKACSGAWPATLGRTLPATRPSYAELQKS